MVVPVFESEAADDDGSEPRAIRNLVRRHLEGLAPSVPHGRRFGRGFLKQAVRMLGPGPPDFSVVLEETQQSGPTALMAQRILSELNETGSDRPSGDKEKARDGKLRAILERHVFEFLEQPVAVPGTRSRARLLSFFDERLDDLASSEEAVCNGIVNAVDPRGAAALFLIQRGCDLMGGGAAITYPVLSGTGPVQKILLSLLADGSCSGPPLAAHGSAFEAALRSAGLGADGPAYGDLCLGSSLALFNHACRLWRRHRGVFHLLGAMHLMETGLAVSMWPRYEMLRRVFGDTLDTHCFDPDPKTDRGLKHRAIQRLIVTALDDLGAVIVPQIAQGFEESWRLRRMANVDLLQQIAWSDGRAGYRTRPEDGTFRVLADWPQLEKTTVVASLGEPAVTHVHDRTVLLVVRDGLLDLKTGHDHVVRLAAGEGMLIPDSRLHGPAAATDICRYDLYPIDCANPC